MTFVAIKPKGFHDLDKAIVRAELDRLGRQVTAETQQYPPWRAWKRPPKSGPRAGGRRTGALGHSWRWDVSSAGATTLTVKSTGVKYARWVQGRDQTRVMSGRGWVTVRRNLGKYAPETKRRLALWAKLKVR